MLQKVIDRLGKIDDLINKKKTGTPKELSQKLKISERSVRNSICTLKKLGAPISFCRKNRSYYYSKEGYFCFRYYKFSTPLDKNNKPKYK